ncbi:MAG: cephalosporin hydroxylase family protein [Chitinophagaceae bacterium]|nr:cephalosporin hydroxylase family protein [Chitinophagaceae bacterium]MBK9571036.1 cephalosporin hydroxylase family protein [Chitinophagaceae bacterium]MBL0272942.1 cephalosporin hydroxylase family protein [Chitinophagaceae bacterium]
MNPIEEFKKERAEAMAAMANDTELKKKSVDWMLHADKYKYTYNFTWMGRPIIKYPQDIAIMQELVWDVKPDLIIETGIAHGGSIIFSSSMMELLGNGGKVIAVDIDIRQHNREAIEQHPMMKNITMLEGSSVDEKIVQQIADYAKGFKKVMVVLDSNHSHEHVYRELELYTPLVSIGSYILLPDTFVEFFPKGYVTNRPWDVGNNPYTAMEAFLKTTTRFVKDEMITNKLLITEALGGGYLKRIS